MISHIDRKLAQQIVSTVKDVCGYDINFIDASGLIFASTDPKRIGSFHEIGRQVAATGVLLEVEKDDSYQGTHRGVNLPVYHNGALIAVIGISGAPQEVRRYAYLAERITRLLIREQELNVYSRSQAEKKNYIIQSLVSGEYTNREYLIRCMEEFGMKESGEKRMLLIQIDSRYNLTNLSMIEGKINQLFDAVNIRVSSYQYPCDYLAVMEESDYQANLYKMRKFSETTGNGILKIAAGGSCQLYQLRDSYRECLTAMKSADFCGGSMILFDELTLELVTGELEEKTREDFLKKTISMLSEEDCSLLKIYYEEEMSLTNTCSRLFLHKNSLQYKLNRIAEQSGKNPRKFRDAVLFYLALRMKEDATSRNS